MTPEEYGAAYEKGRILTQRLLVSKGVYYDVALEIAQAAWVRGWEKRDQLKNPRMTLTWVNTIALNLFRGMLRREPAQKSLPLLRFSDPDITEAIDTERTVARILRLSTVSDRKLLSLYYLQDHTVEEIMKMTGWGETATRIRLHRARVQTRERVGAVC